MFASLFAAVLAALVALVAPHPVAAHRSAAGHPSGGTVDYTAPAPGAPHSGRPSVGKAAPSGAPTVAPTPAAQLPEEVIGRQIDCPDGSVGQVVDVAGDVSCP